MNKLTKFIRCAGSKVNKYSPEILIGLGIAGFISSTIMAVKATPKALEKAEDAVLDKEDSYPEDTDLTSPKIKRELAWTKVKAMAPYYIPATLLAASSTACVICSNRISNKRQATLAAAYSMSREALETYQKKVVEKLGEKKEELIRDEVAKEAIANDPKSNHPDIVLVEGEMLCYDKVIGRYFKSNVDAIRKAESVCNRRLISEMYISLNEFYDELDLPHVEIGDDLGWNVDDMIEIYFSSQLADDNTPCLVIYYDYAPRYDFRKDH